jgi:mannose-6-phosphate isomerase-like protein (cupin superfamily)
MRSGTVLKNPLTGQFVTVVVAPRDTGGRSFVAEWTIAPRRGRDGVPEHLHPQLSETFAVHSGRGRYRLGGREAELGPGDEIVMPAGVAHIHPWSVSAEPLRYRQTAESPVPVERDMLAALLGLQTIFGLAREGKTNKQGVPNALQLAVIGHSMMPGTFLASPPIALQRVAVPVVAAFGRALGYRSTYPRHAT